MKLNVFYLFVILILISPVIYLIIFNFYETKLNDSNYNKNKIQDSIDFIVLGDWGGKQVEPFFNAVQLKVAKSMIDYSKKVNISFIISTGDNFYDYGLNSWNDSRINKTFVDVYLKNDKKFSKIDWYLVAGNHDHHTNDIGKYQLSSLNPYLPKQWNFPDFLYTKKILLSNVNKQIKIFRFIFIDTTIMCNLYEVKLFDNKRNILNETYFRLFKQELIKSHNKNESIILFGHHPLYSVQKSEKPSIYCFHNNFLSLFKKYRIIAYISGHDHSLQYGIYHKVHLLTSAGGIGLYHKNRINDSELNKNYQLGFYHSDDGKYKTGGFLAIKLSFNQLNFSFLGTNGENLFNKTIFI